MVGNGTVANKKIKEKPMEFYGREREIDELRKERTTSQKYARFTVVTGRRRIGKTQLIRQALDDSVTPYVHLVITKKVEKVQTEAHQHTVERCLGLQFHGTCVRFAELFEELMKESLKRPLTLVLDEFQEFDKVDDAIFGEIAGVWDQYHSKSRINLVVCGSVNRLMNKIFFDDSQPLYGRSTGKLSLMPFDAPVFKRILSDFSPKWKPEDLLDLWTITGGVPRYVELLMENGACDRADMLKVVFGGITSFIDEGRTVLSDEFGKEYGTYFTILSSIASGKTTFAELSNELGSDIGGYLTRLETQFGLVSKRQPLYETVKTKNCHYQVEDCFFRFWFRFVVGHQDLVELNQLDELRKIAMRDFDTFSGYALERYFFWKFQTERKYVKMGAWWDRKGENEIDLVCERPDGGALDFYEVKRDPVRYSPVALQAKTIAFFQKNPSLSRRPFACRGLSLKDM